jgi:hypothetical protein
MGKLLAIHAGLTYDMNAAQGIREELGLAPPGRHTCSKGAVVAVARLAKAVRDSNSRWAVPGQWHWCLEGTVHLARPVACKGAQGLWLLPPKVLAEVREQLLGRVDMAQAMVGLSATEGPPTGFQQALAEACAATRQGHHTKPKGVAQILPCVDCKRLVYWYGSTPEPRHGFNRIGGPTGRIDCLGRPAPEGTP